LASARMKSLAAAGFACMFANFKSRLFCTM
jgi:hypothetical protein